MHTKILSATTIGVDAHPVDVEVDLSFGMIQFHVVGLPDTAIKESRQRVATALKNCGVRLPEKKITVNLAPADIKKEGSLFDLPIALGILQASEFLSLTRQFLNETVVIGELSLDGTIKPVRGVLPIARGMKIAGKKRIIVPKENALEAAFIEGLEVLGAAHLLELIAHVRGEALIAPTPQTTAETDSPESTLDFSDVSGQNQAKRALQIAAAGRHNILFIGSPGSGKTMLAQRLFTLMPPLSLDEILEVSAIYSVSGKLGSQSLVTHRPFRTPHHTISQAGLVGGGSFPQPGEISLAHNGILFLDEFVEFKRSTLEVLRQPLENKSVCISRAQQSVTFPAAFLLVAALNPCPCGYHGDKKRPCTCSPLQIRHYIDRLSGPLLDRIDLQVPVQAVNYETINKKSPATSSADLYKGVLNAIKRQAERFKDPRQFNAFMTPRQLNEFCILSEPAQLLVQQTFEKLGLSMRGYHKLLKISRTIADLEGMDVLELHHVQEAIMYRSLEQTLERM
ncbi:TPA: hypothetical protein DDZ86_01940 [Candidatus Dependentiae bacterium]|nr:MAG: Mg chelatase, subunit ChlI [candidate division TM6 bacterium GW2011_GWF2_43_87]HBL98385.1 hypothetical protein [Candidatus Dependentiae bacterium]